VSAAPSLELGLSPQDLGLPAKFQRWRPYQEDAILSAASSQKRFVAQAVPTGGGKSLSYVAQAILGGHRVVVLTSTKGLQDQLRSDFSSLGMTDIRGRANYRCHMSPGMTCEDGAHAGCRSNGTAGCPYTCAYKIAKAAPFVVTNYPYFMLQHKFGEGLGSFDLLVLDEAHNAPEEICSVMSVSITSREVYRMLRSDFPPDGSSIGTWSAWAGELLPAARVECDRLSDLAKSRIGGVSLAEARELREWKNLVSKLETLAEARGEWEAEAIKGGYKIDPVWASQYADILFLKVPHVLMVSATVVPKTLDLLGLAREDYDYQEYPSTFPPRRSPLIYVPTVRVTHKWQPWMMELWLDRIDQVIGRRLDRKGIIHTVSYDRRNAILERSKYSEYMISHSTRDAVQQVEVFRESQPPSFLVSPALATGWDFSYDDCELGLIVKIPYPDTRSRIMRARVRADPDYANHVMTQNLIQMCGRPMRAPDDQCENICIDDMIRVVMATCGDMLLGWFRKLYRRSDILPEPPPRLERRNKA
jgi:Rad3-related DNA helicase